MLKDFFRILLYLTTNRKRRLPHCLRKLFSKFHLTIHHRNSFLLLYHIFCIRLTEIKFSLHSLRLYFYNPFFLQSLSFIVMGNNSFFKWCFIYHLVFDLYATADLPILNNFPLFFRNYFVFHIFSKNTSLIF
jgi:hypothetical protein